MTPRREGDDLVFVRKNDENTRLGIENWYLGAEYRPDAIMNDRGGVWDAEEIERIAYLEK